MRRSSTLPNYRVIGSVLDRAAIILGWLPAAWLVALMTLALRARVHLGHWPRPYRPDPKDLPFAWHYIFVEKGMFVVLAGVGAMVAFALLARRFVSAHVYRRSLIAFALGWALIVVMLSVPPIDFVNWFLD